MDATDEKLLLETNKWLARLVKKADSLKPKNNSKELANSIENIYAYIEDCGHFLEKKDYVNAFEAVIYAWGILETLERLRLVDS